MCNKKGDRGCWVKFPDREFNVKTDYEDFVPEGEERTYNLRLSQMPLTLDGTIKPEAKVFNEVFPGPLIEACWGDTLVVNVKNDLPRNGTTIHWHGIRMLDENHMDGVNGITQCPISEGESMTYRFKLRQYGTSWYHSHYSSQYSDGVLGPLVIHGPSSDDDWEEELEPIVVTDWVHRSAFELFHTELEGGAPPKADSILVNGVGRFNNAGDYYKQKFEPGKKYLIRIINGSTGLHFHWSLDNHIIKVIAADFVPIKPYTTTSLSMGIGQRYTVIIEAKPTTSSTDGKYWMRTESQRTGIVSYSNATGTDDPSTTRHDAPVACLDETPKHTPIVEWTVSPPQNDFREHTFEAGLDNKNKNVWRHAVTRWSLTDTPMWLDFSNPTLMNLKNTSWNPEYGVVHYNQTNGDEFVYMVITYGNQRTSPLQKSGVTPHPIHLHGHDFAIIGQSNTAYDPEVSPKLFNLANPPRRDVVMLPRNGYLAIAFKPDNPGAWVLHCHISWHAGSGLALQVLERQSEIEERLGAGTFDKMKKQCDSWNSWLEKNPHKFNPVIDQEDSGI
ncbi:multicopper oxidase [Sporormia fimetaria CBS 119925]|uniref:Multicopper oxidase n=1 Tax=Sporormia fimetaria CBS 119925 TaxID=1340428 RepID=A0A6A6UZ83_9PLEO|nr:multicopper oxidase [Sporormia fimetaria CBS 119925]